MLTSKAMRGLHRPVCEALGSALLSQQLAQAAAHAATQSWRNGLGDGAGGEAMPCLGERSESGGDESGLGVSFLNASGRDALAVVGHRDGAVLAIDGDGLVCRTHACTQELKSQQ